MKKRLALLIALMLCISILAVPAAADDGHIAIVAKVPDGWANPTVYAWGSGTYTNSWPGNALTDLGDGWFYGYIPANPDGVIIAANNGTIQTVDLKEYDGSKDMWITVGSDDGSGKYNASISHSKQNTAEVPAYSGPSSPSGGSVAGSTNKTFTIHANVPLSWPGANMYVWYNGTGEYAEAWPGSAMTEGNDGWFVAEAPAWVDSLIINDGNGKQTADISIEPRELFITVNEDLTYTIEYATDGSGSGDGNTDTPSNETVTVHAWVPSDWTGPCLWAWDDSTGTIVNAAVSGAWPGDAMTQDGDWWTIEMPAWVNWVIVNGANGGYQCADTPVEAGKDIWIVASEHQAEAKIYYEEPDVPTETEPSVPDTSKPDTNKPDTNKPDDNQAPTVYPGVIIGIVIAVVGIAGSVTAVVIHKKKLKK